MQTVTLSFPDTLGPRIVEAFCNRFGYAPETGLTKGQFFKRCLRLYTLEIVSAYEIERNAETARRTKALELEGEFNGLPPDV